MEGERRKRKVEEKEENEDEKMENFFALIKSSRVVRERMAAAENRGKAAGGLRPPAAAWNPTFRLEDFLEPAAEKAEAGPSFAEGDKQEIAGTDEGGKAIGDDKGLDLNLSL